MSDEDTAILLSKETPAVSQPVKIRNVKVVSKPDVQHYKNGLPAVGAILCSGIAFGFDIGIYCYNVHQLRTAYKLNCHREDLLLLSWLMGTFLSCVSGGSLMDACGRKRFMIFSAATLSLGTVIPVTVESYVLLLCGRFICGLSGAMSVVVQCTYACETSDDCWRGCRVILHQLGMAIGLLISAVLGTTEIHWQYVSWMAAVPAILGAIITAALLVESPPFEVVKMTRATLGIRPSCDAICSIYSTILMGFILVCFHRFVGRMEVFHYSFKMLLSLGTCMAAAKNIATLMFHTIKVCGVALCAASVDRIGRRTILIMGATCMTVSLVMLGILSLLEEEEVKNISTTTTCMDAGVADVPRQEDGVLFSVGPVVAPPPLLPTGVPPPYPLLPTPLSLTELKEDCLKLPATPSPEFSFIALVFVILYELAFSFSLGPVILLLLVEMFPVAIRCRAMSISLFFYWIIDFLMPTIITSSLGHLTEGGLFFVFACIRAIYIVFVFLFLQETRGKSLHVIAQELKNVPLKVRMYRNLYAIPCLKRSEWLHRQSHSCRETSHPISESTAI